MEYCAVFGSPRSGTTYVTELLATLRGAEARHGGLLPVSLMHVVNQGVSNEVERSLQGSLKRNIEIYLDSDRYDSRLLALEEWWETPLQIEKLRDHVLWPGNRPRPDWFIYQEPFFSLAPEFAFASLPEAKMIYLHRDGRDVANSLVESYDVLTDEKLTHWNSAEIRMGRKYDHRYVPWWVEEGRDEEFLDACPYVRAIWMWSYMIRRCESYFEDLSETASRRLLKVQYEELVRRPEEWGQRICEHLGVDSTTAYRRHLSQAHTSSIGKHRRRPERELEAATQLAEDRLSEMGYI